MGKIKVLLAEDHTIVRHGLRALLEGEGGIEVIGDAEDGREAVRKVEQLRPDVVVMDISMPGANGIDATRRLKREVPDAQVIVLTGYDLRAFQEAALCSGASGYVNKKALVEALLPAIRDICSMHEVQ